MHITRTEEASPNTQSQYAHSILKIAMAHGAATQIIKRHDGNFLNIDYEVLHSIDL